jgi:hypothetical protein
MRTRSARRPLRSCGNEDRAKCLDGVVVNSLLLHCENIIINKLNDVLDLILLDDLTKCEGNLCIVVFVILKY